MSTTELKESLYARVGILEDNQVIGKKEADFTRRAVDMLLAEKPDASMRAEQGIAENPIDAAILEAAAYEPSWEKAVDFRDRLMKETDIAFPQTEKDFLSVHLCNLFAE